MHDDPFRDIPEGLRETMKVMAVRTPKRHSPLSNAPHSAMPSGAVFPSVTLIGLGNWGTALAFALHAAGISVREVVVRNRRASDRRLADKIGARSTTLQHSMLDADILWICTPDARIAETAQDLAHRVAQLRRTAASARTPRLQQKPARPIVLHSSGALPSAELSALRTVGASLASAHPLMTFPRKNVAHTSLAGVPFAVEGDTRACREARKLVRALGGEAFVLRAENKPLYHAFGAFASPLIIALLTATTEAGVAAGFSPKDARRLMRPIVERTIANFFTDGPDKSFSGPIARGDAATIARHLDALRPYPKLAAIYRESSRFALTSLPTRNRTQMERLLDPPRDGIRKKPASRGRSPASTA